MIVLPSKRPDAVLNYRLDWSSLLLGSDTILTKNVTPTGVVVDSDTIDTDATGIDLVLSGGTDGTVAKVIAAITTANGLTDSEIAVLEIGGDVISLAQAKTALKIETDDEDVVLAGFLRAAIGHIERITGKKLRPKIVSETLDGFPRLTIDARYPFVQHPIWLAYGPASEILSIDYDDRDGVTQTFDGFRLVPGANAKLMPAYGSCWPRTAHGPGTVRLSYVAGFDATELPSELLHSVMLLFGHFEANREAAVISERVAAVELPLGVQALIADHCPR